MITVLQDTQLLAHIDGGDLIEKETKYHLKCLTSLRNCYRSQLRKSNQEEQAYTVEENMNRSRVLVELASYIDKSVRSGTSFFKLSEIHSLYMNRLKYFGISSGGNKNQTEGSFAETLPWGTRTV